MTAKINYPHIKIEENQPPRLQRIPRVRVAQIVMDYLAYCSHGLVCIFP
ncbi:hypothetical protein [Dapis sp. BLCC M229]